MATILLQTTITDVEDDWSIERFSLLADELRGAGHRVTARNRDEGFGDDPVLSTLDTSEFDQLWLMAVDTGLGLSANDAAAILRFRERGGGVLTARDHHDLGSCLYSLGSIGRVNHFHTNNPEPDALRDDEDNPGISWPNYHSGANGAYQRVHPVDPPHELLANPDSPSGSIDWFPAHPHEGSVRDVEALSFVRTVGQGQSMVTGRLFNLAVALDGETDADGRLLGRAVCCSTFHHLVDLNWDVRRGAPSFVTDLPSSEMLDEPERLEIYKGYVRNLANWLRPTATSASAPAV